MTEANTQATQPDLKAGDSLYYVTDKGDIKEVSIIRCSRACDRVTYTIQRSPRSARDFFTVYDEDSYRFLQCVQPTMKDALEFAIKQAKEKAKYAAKQIEVFEKTMQRWHGLQSSYQQKLKELS